MRVHRFCFNYSFLLVIELHNNIISTRDIQLFVTFNSSVILKFEENKKQKKVHKNQSSHRNRYIPRVMV